MEAFGTGHKIRKQYKNNRDKIKKKYKIIFDNNVHNKIIIFISCLVIVNKTK
jgi:hypothetical protein